MSTCLKRAMLVGASCVALAQGAQAEEGRFSWEGEVEVGIDSVFDSNVPGNEGKDPFLKVEVAAAFALSEYFSVFGGLTLEEMTGPSGSIEDLGLYVHELGFQFGNDRVTARVGKITPSFGTAWDAAPGYFASSLAEDYELTEQVGATVDFAVGETGTLSVGLFYADDTSLSRSWGFNRGKNRTVLGGAGNTGRLDNGAIQWMQELGSTTYHVGLRHLSKGTGDVKDETGVVAGVAHSFAEAGMPLELYAEVASFEGFGGSADDAVYATLGSAYLLGDTALSAAISHRDIDNFGSTSIFSLGVDHEFENGITIGGAIGRVDDVLGAEESIFGVSMVIPLGG
ncbi:MAG: hypothetical protein RIA08_21495 [Roseovarius sp.]|uniref:hypothetical protein n=2 Tax=Roseovarius sp. TaxID=1486281 RepID=UPI0032EC8E0F